jgi:hypothetical protein
VTSRYNVLRLHYSRPVILAVEEAAISFLCAGWRALEWNVSTLRADHYFRPLDIVTGREDANGFSDGAFRTLTPVIDCSVQQVHALTEGSNDCCRVTAVFGVIAFTEVRPEAERGDYDIVRERSIEMVDLPILEPFSKSLRAFRGGASLDKRLQCFGPTHWGEATDVGQLAQVDVA